MPPITTVFCIVLIFVYPAGTQVDPSVITHRIYTVLVWQKGCYGTVIWSDHKGEI